MTKMNEIPHYKTKILQMLKDSPGGINPHDASEKFNVTTFAVVRALQYYVQQGIAIRELSHETKRYIYKLKEVKQ